MSDKIPNNGYFIKNMQYLTNLFPIFHLLLLPGKFLPFNWLRAEVFQLNLKYLHVKITVTMVTQNHQIISSHELRKNRGKIFTREILFLPLEHKIHIFSPPCNILSIYFLNRKMFTRIRLFFDFAFFV